jgi:hypothetical protein
MHARAGHVRGEPLAVRERNHAVVGALPDRDRHVDRAQLEPPGLDEREVVVDPAGDPARQRAPDHPRHRVGQLAGQRAAIHIVDEVAQRVGDLLPRHRGERRGPGLEKLLEVGARARRARELVDVLLPHARQEVEPLGVVRRGAGQARRRPAAVREQRGACERVRTAA